MGFFKKTALAQRGSGVAITVHGATSNRSRTVGDEIIDAVFDGGLDLGAGETAWMVCL